MTAIAREALARKREAERLAKTSLNTRRASGQPPSLEALRDGLLYDLESLAEKCRQAIGTLPKDRAQDHRALASTLIALSERVDAMLASRVGMGGSESYEHRLARAYKAQGLALPGRLAASLGQRSEPAEPTPPTFPAQDDVLRQVTPSLDENLLETVIVDEDEQLTYDDLLEEVEEL